MIDNRIPINAYNCFGASFLSLEFKGDAIVLSGETGTKLKCDILAGYYPLWWSITSGGPNRDFRLRTSIVEMNAGTTVDYIKDIEEEIFGSAGHALNLKINDERDTSKLKVILFEESPKCFDHLKHAITANWPSLNLKQSLGKITSNETGVFLFNQGASDALDTIESIPYLGNSLFFFDTLLYSSWTDIERVARRRIKSYYHTQTEFIVFLFTSDFLDGRKKAELAPLPKTLNESDWTEEESETVKKVDDLFGHKHWRHNILTNENRKTRMDKLVGAYRNRLHTWFRYVLPLPFNPKDDQEYYLFMCSNFETGVRITRRFYSDFSGNPQYSPNANQMYEKFKGIHPSLVQGYRGNERPLYWRYLNKVIHEHEEGICDIYCQDLWDLTRSQDPWQERIDCLNWLADNKYLDRIQSLTLEWPEKKIPFYRLNWDIVTKRLGVDPPLPFTPLKPKKKKDD